MMRLGMPEKDYIATLEECIQGITGNINLKSNLIMAKPALIQAADNYLTVGRLGELCTIVPINTTVDKDPIVAGEVRKSEMVKLYEYYLRNEEKDARKIYDQILSAAKEKCPFCGGIGTPRNLDHFLPKAHFPQFSTFPQNLVPSCRDCNMDGKSEYFARVASKQVIQPYIDHERFFSDQWIFADYVVFSKEMPGVLRYCVRPPDDWDKVHRDRVLQHFSDFGLAKRYSVKAAELLGITLAQIAAMQVLGVVGVARQRWPGHVQRAVRDDPQRQDQG